MFDEKSFSAACKVRTLQIVCLGNILSGNSRGAAFDEAFDFSQRGGAGIAGGGHGECAVSNAAADGPVDGFGGEQAVDEAGGEAVAAADAVVDVDVALGDVDDLIFIESDGAPGIAAGCGGGAEGAGDELEVGVGSGDFAEHGFVTGNGQLGEVFADAFDGYAEHGGEVFFVAEEQIDLADQFAVDLLGLGFAADAFPKGITEVEVVGDGGRVAARGIHGFGGDLGGGGGERGEDAAGVEPLRGVLVSEYRGPIKIAGVELADRGVAAVGTAGGGADAEAALSEVKSVADGASDAVVGNPLDEGGIDAALEDEVFNEAANGIVGQSSGDGGAEREAAAQASGHVVFAAAFPDLEVASGVDAAFAGIEAEHDFAERETVPAAGGIGNDERVHGVRTAFT